jgi:hypothetical protein
MTKKKTAEEKKEAAEAKKGKTAETEINEKPDKLVETEEDEKKVVRPIDAELVKELVRYDFNQDELVELSEELIDLIEREKRLTAEKKSAAAKFDSDIKTTVIGRDDLLKKMSDKFEMVTMPCVCVRDYRKGVVYYFRDDQIEVDSLRIYDQDQFFALVEGGALGVDPVKTRDIKPWERQRALDFVPVEDEQVKEGEEVEPPEIDGNIPGSETVTTY